MPLPTDATQRTETTRSVWLAVLAILVVGLLCYAPCLDAAELDKEEARRALPAREMLQSGDYVVPTIWERTYLAKPPMMFWTIAAVASLRGGVDELATRIPSVAGTLLTALLLFFFGRRVFGASTGLVAALLFLVSPGVFEKGALGELEATLALYVFAASACLWMSVQETASARSRRVFVALGCVALSAGTMTKGPVALLFHGGALLGVLFAKKQLRLLLRPVCWLPVVVALAVLGTWVLLVIQHVDGDRAVSTWTAEMSRAKDLGLGNYWKDRRKFTVGILAAFLPGSLLCLTGCLARFRRRSDALPARADSGGPADATMVVRFLAIAMLGTLLFFLLQPGARTRFYYPVLPWCALVGGHLVVRAFARRWLWTVHLLVALVALLGVTMVAGGVVLHFRMIQDIGVFSAFGHVLLVLLAATVVWTVRGFWRPPCLARLIAPLALVVCARLVHVTELIPQHEAEQVKHAFGRKLDELVPEGEIVDLRFWKGFNELSYTRRRLVHAEVAEPVGEHRYVLAFAGDVEQLERQSERKLVEVAPLRLVAGDWLKLLEVR